MDSQTLADLCQQTQQIPLLAFAWTLLVAAILVTALRLYSKSKNISGITADDYLALASTVFAAIAVSFLTVWIHAGLGRHAQCLNDPQFTLLWSLIAQILNIVGICLLKVSICTGVLQVLDHELRLLRSSVWILAIFLTVSHITHIVLLLLQCKPLDAIWYASVQDAQCFSRWQLALMYYVEYGIGASTDLFCASIPLAVLYHLRLSGNSRIGLCVLVGFGTLITGCAVAKTITISGAWSADFTWNSAVPTWFTIAEYYGGIVVASIPSLVGLLAPKAKSNPTLYNVDGARNGSLYSMPRKGSAWTLATTRIPRPALAKKHFSISTFGLNEGEYGSRLTLVENRFTVVGEDEDRLTCVAEEGDDVHERATSDSRSVRTATLKGSYDAWNQEDAIGLGALGKDDAFYKDSNIRQQGETSASSLYSIGRSTRPSTPKGSTLRRLTISTRPTTPGSASRSSSRPETPKSPGFPRTPATPRMPGTPKRSARTSVASSTYSDPPISAGLATIPSPPASARTLPKISEVSSRPTTPKMPAWAASPSGFTAPNGSRTPTGYRSRTPTGSGSRTSNGSSTPRVGSRPGTPKMPTWAASAPGFTAPDGSKTPTGYRSRTPTGSGSRTPNGSSTPRGGSRPGTPKGSRSVAVPVSKFRAEISEEMTAEVRRVGKFSDLEKAKGKALPQPPLEVLVVDIPAVKRFDPHDASY